MSQRRCRIVARPNGAIPVDDICKLKQANGLQDSDCVGEQCIFWRAVEDLGEPVGTGCAVQYYEMLGDEGMAAWLLSVKERVERAESKPGE